MVEEVVLKIEISKWSIQYVVHILVKGRSHQTIIIGERAFN